MNQNKSYVKEIFSHTVIYGFGIVLNKSVNFILLPLYTKYYSPEQMGLFTLIQSLSLFMGVLYKFGMETSFMKFFIDEKEDKNKSEIYSSTLFAISVTSLFLSAVIFICSDFIAVLFNFDDFVESNFLIKILAVLLFVDTLGRFPLLLFRAELNTKNFAYLNLFTFILNIAGNYIFVVKLKYGVEAIFYCYIISTFITLLAGLLLTSKYLTFRISFRKIRELFYYGNKFIYVGIFIILIDMSDRFFLKYYFGESVVGIYWANYRLATVMSLAIAAFRFSWTPYFLNLTSNPGHKKIISGIFTYFIFAGLFLFLTFSLLINQLVKITFFGYNFLDVTYWSGLNIVPVVLLAYFFSGILSVFNAAPFFANKTGSLLAFSFSGFVINTIFNFTLLPLYGNMGAALATLITYMAMSALVYFYSQKVYKIEYDYDKIKKLTLITAIFFSAGYFFVNQLEINRAFIIIIDVLLIMIYLLSLSRFKIIELKKVSMLWKN